MGQNGLNAPGEFAPGQHYLAMAGQTFNFDISPQPEDTPFISPTWMRFSQPELVVKL